MAFMKISQQRGRVPVTVFHLQERINLGNFAELEKVAQREYEKGMRNLVIDLSGTEALSSIGVRGLVIIHKMLAKAGEGRLKLSGATPSMRDVLEIAGITQFLEMYDTVEKAVASF